ncbi:phage minor tail protein L [Pseudomonas sp. 18175]|uniref:phage minor tail protein L n=1 Tax=Pseudomonas sp. 18175 TaxID=3390056 RepID=UPI003D1B03EB
MAINTDVQLLEPGDAVRLYEVDATHLGGDLMRFHGHMQDGTIIWQGQAYEPISIEAKGLDLNGDGRPALPTLTVGNEIAGIRGALSALCLHLDDLAGAKVTIRETFRHYLDAANFPEGNPQASDQQRVMSWFIEQKTDEDEMQLEFQLSSPADLQGIKVPTQQITSLCRWACMNQYRGEACAYIGTALFTKHDEPTDDPAQDRCAGRWRSCKVRGNTARFGGAPGSSLIIRR